MLLEFHRRFRQFAVSWQARPSSINLRSASERASLWRSAQCPRPESDARVPETSALGLCPLPDVRAF